MTPDNDTGVDTGVNTEAPVSVSVSTPEKAGVTHPYPAPSRWDVTLPLTHAACDISKLPGAF